MSRMSWSSPSPARGSKAQAALSHHPNGVWPSHPLEARGSGGKGTVPPTLSISPTECNSEGTKGGLRPAVGRGAHHAPSRAAAGSCADSSVVILTGI